jgi:hypothetical protein
MEIRDCIVVASPQHAAALGGIDKAEDVAFAPTGDRLVVAGYGGDTLGVAIVRIDRTGPATRVYLDDVALVSHPRFAQPHGVAFLDRTTVLVANRSGGVLFARLGVDGDPVVEIVEPVAGHDFAELDGPNSVTVTTAVGEVHTVIVCNTNGQRVTRHRVVLDLHGIPAVTASDVVLDRWLDIPDGAALSPDGSLLAISNHRHHLVMLYDATALGDGDEIPVAVLRGVRYPHGLAWVADGSELVAADAGAPFLHRFTAPPGGWCGVVTPTWSRRILPGHEYRAARVNSREGGAKGLALHPDGRTLAVSTRQRAVTFFDLDPDAAPTTPALDAAARVRHELDLIEEDLEWRFLDAQHLIAPPAPRPVTVTARIRGVARRAGRSLRRR